MDKLKSPLLYVFVLLLITKVQTQDVAPSPLNDKAVADAFPGSVVPSQGGVSTVTLSAITSSAVTSFDGADPVTKPSTNVAPPPLNDKAVAGAFPGSVVTSHGGVSTVTLSAITSTDVTSSDGADPVAKPSTSPGQTQTTAAPKSSSMRISSIIATVGAALNKVAGGANATVVPDAGGANKTPRVSTGKPATPVNSSGSKDDAKNAPAVGSMEAATLAGAKQVTSVAPSAATVPIKASTAVTVNKLSVATTKPTTTTTTLLTTLAAKTMTTKKVATPAATVTLKATTASKATASTAADAITFDDVTVKSIEDDKAVDVNSNSNPGDTSGGVGQTENRLGGKANFAPPQNSHFLFYMITLGVVVALVYIVYHNKKKVMGLLIEGRRSPSGSVSKRRGYKKLQTNDPDIEETLPTDGRHVIY